MNLTKRILILLALTFSAVTFTGNAFAKRDLPGEASTVKEDVEPVLIVLLQISIGVALVLGLALWPNEKTRSKANGLLVGVAGVVAILLLSTDYLSSFTKPLAGLLNNSGKVSDLLKSNGGG